MYAAMASGRNMYPAFAVLINDHLSRAVVLPVGAAG